jgi:uncharacterized membrane protein YbhN (UPF0104 family)
LVSFFQRLLLVAILAFALGFCWYNRSTLAIAWQLQLWQWALLLGAYFACFWLNALMACQVQWRRGTKPALWEMLVINAYASILGYVTVFRAGFYSSKVWFFKQRYQLPITVSLGLQGWVSLVVLVANAGFALVLGLWLLLVEQASLPLLYWLLMVGTLALAGGLLLGLFYLQGQAWLPQRVDRWLSNVRTVVSGTSAAELGQLSLWALLNIPLQALAFALLCQVFQLSIPISYLLLTAVIANLSIVIALTPGNLGVRELVLWQLLRNLDLDDNTLLSLMMVDRVVQFAVLTVICLFGYRMLNFGKATTNT